MFRKPDYNFGQDWAIWYGPSGSNGDCATEAEAYGNGAYCVREFTDIRGLFDDYDKAVPFLCIEVYVSAEEIAVEQAKQHAIAGRFSTRLAANLGAQKIAEQGGNESFVSELPQA